MGAARFLRASELPEVWPLMPTATNQSVSATATTSPPLRRAGCTLAQGRCAQEVAGGIPESLGLEDVKYQGAPADTERLFAGPTAAKWRCCTVWSCSGPVPGFCSNGRENASRRHTGWSASIRPRWPDRWPSSRALRCAALWYHNSQVLGLPSARWDEKWADYLDGITTIYVVIEPDSAGQKVRRAFEQSSVKQRVRFVDLGALKDPSGCTRRSCGVQHAVDCRPRGGYAMDGFDRAGEP